MKRLCAASFLSLLIVCGSPPSQACGPFLNEAILDLGFAILRAPKTSFELEMGRIRMDKPLPGGLEMPSEIAPFSSNHKLTEGWEKLLFETSGDDLIADTDGCRTRLLATNVDLARDVAEVATFLNNGAELEEYRTLRAKMVPGKMQVMPFIDPADLIRATNQINNRNWPGFLPEEFKIYLDGATDFSAGQWDAAIINFEKLMALPREERRYRSTWAAYLRGRAELKKGDVDLQNSIVHFQRLLDFREAGCHDSLGLGWDALRIVADRKMIEGEINEALRYRFAIAWHGRGTVAPMLDLKRWLRDNLRTDLAMDLSRDDSFVRQLFTAAAINSVNAVEYWEDGVELQSDEWLEYLHSVELTSAEAGSAAHLAYEAGDLDSVEAFLKRAPSLDPTAVWLRSKLLAKKGQVRSASREMARMATVPNYERTLHGEIPQYVAYEWPSSETRSYRAGQFWGEQGILHLANDRYEMAMESFILSGHWQDAAYVAEQLLSREELLTYVRDRWPTHESSVKESRNRFPYLMRYLTARRLARDHYFKDARPLFPPDLLPVFDKYVENYRLFRDNSKPDSDRAAAGWEVAQLHRYYGIEMFGTEVGPDFAVWGGSFGGGTGRHFDRLKLSKHSRRAESVSHYRNPVLSELEVENRWRDNWEKKKFAEPVFPQPTPSEKWRWQHYAPLPSGNRWHYRHVAADLAWEAAMLMPIESDESAKVFNIAGSWLAAKHPQKADVFYKAMIRRNWTTPTARHADGRRWFVHHDWWSKYDPWKSLWLPKPDRRDFRLPKELAGTNKQG